MLHLLLVALVAMSAASNPQTSRHLLRDAYRNVFYYPGHDAGVAIGEGVQGRLHFANQPIAFTTAFNLRQTPSPGFRLPPPHRIIDAAAATSYLRPPFGAVHLFEPNTLQQPAETAGQIQNYEKALKEQAEEDEKERNQLSDTFTSGFNIHDDAFPSSLTRFDTPKSYVDVLIRAGDHKHYQYNYRI